MRWLAVRPRQAPRWLRILLWGNLALLAALSVLNQFGADCCWPGAVNLYLPQALWGVPSLLLALVVLRVSPAWSALPLLGLALVAGPLMGLRWQFPGSAEVAPAPATLRVMTWNVKYASRDTLAIATIIYHIDWNNPTVVMLQDAGGLLRGPLGEYLRDWQVRSYGQYIVASRVPLGELQVRRISFPGEEHSCVRTELTVGGRSVVLYNVHFLTPRPAFNALRQARQPLALPAAVQQLKGNVTARLTQVRALSEQLQKERGEVIVAGDLNAPEGSQVCASLKGAGLHDAFDQGGKGYGYTYGHFLLRRRLPSWNLSWLRLDHIMLSSGIRSTNCWTGVGKGSEHRPVIADLVLNTPL